MRCLFRPEPAALAFSLFVAHASYNLYSFRDSAKGRLLFRQFSPAPCSPPLGGSIADSAVRFTPAGKYGGRENRPSGRETRCIRYHPCRAHHKLKWARKMQSVLAVLYSHLPRSESNKAICAANSVAHQRLAANPNSNGSTLFDRGWQQPLDHPGAQPACRVKDAEGTAQPLVLDSVRWLCYLPKSQAAPRRPHFPAVLTSMPCPSLLNTIVPSSSVRSTFTPALPSVSIVLSAG